MTATAVPMDMYTELNRLEMVNVMLSADTTTSPQSEYTAVSALMPTDQSTSFSSSGAPMRSTFLNSAAGTFSVRYAPSIKVKRL